MGGNFSAVLCNQRGVLKKRFLVRAGRWRLLQIARNYCSIMACGWPRAADDGMLLALPVGWSQVSYPARNCNTALGTLLTYCDERRRALLRFEAAVEQSPASCDCLFNRASAQRMVGDLSGAEATLQDVIRLSPHHGAAHLMRSGLRTQTESANHIADLREALRHSNDNSLNLVSLQFALGKEFEDVKRFDDAFNAFEVGCRLQRRRMRYDVSADVDVIDRIIGAHTGVAIGTDSGFRTKEPIFVLGLPRSGTTLVAQILASHSAVQSIGETPALAAETIGAVRRRVGRDVGKIDFVSKAFEVDASELGKSYVEATRPQTGRTAHFVDKAPTNYLYVGVIARSLPSAKIVAVARDPMDVCVAMFKTLFTGAYPFSYDLVELGRYYTAWHRLMRHWQDVLGDRVLVVQYEDLINDQARVTRQLLKHCGLEWEDGLSRF